MFSWIMKYRNVLLLGVLVIMLAVSSQLNTERLAEETKTVSLPVAYPGNDTVTDPMEQYRQQRDETAMQDMAALQALVDAEKLDDQTRQDAAQRLATLVERREQQMDLEGALLESGLWPCVAVVSTGSVTIVTEKETLSDSERTLLLTMVQAHTSVDAGSVRIVCNGEEEK